MKQFLKAIDHGLTAFLNELWPFDFPPAWFDPGDALEDEVVSKGVFAESSPVVARQAPGELSPDGDGGPPSPSPSGYPDLNGKELLDIQYALKSLADFPESGAYAMQQGRDYWESLRKRVAYLYAETLYQK